MLGFNALARLALGQASDTAATVLAAAPGAFVLTGQATVDLSAEIAACGLFALAGEPSLGHDVTNIGGAIAAGTFSRGRWRALQEELAAERKAERDEVAAQRRRRRAQAQAAARAARERAQAARAQIAQANAAAAGARVLDDALAAAAGVRRSQNLMRHAATLHALAVAAQARAQAQDEDEALALLLAA